MGGGAAGHGDGLEAVEFVPPVLARFPGQEVGQAYGSPGSKGGVHGRQSSMGRHVKSRIMWVGG